MVDAKSLSRISRIKNDVSKRINFILLKQEEEEDDDDDMKAAAWNI